MTALYSGTVRVDASAKPAAIDFEHAEGGLKGKTWKGIYALDGNNSQFATTQRTWVLLDP